jgi:colanic acid/amylovoran biosynthesis glycosyltransferase
MKPITVDICAYDALDNTGGPYVWIQRLPLKLQEMGYDVHVHLFSWHAPELGIAYRTLRDVGISVSPAVFGDTISNVRWLLKSAELRRPDVFIANHVIPAFYAARYLKEAGIPTVGILRSDDPFYHGIMERFVCSEGPFQVSAVVCVSDFLRKTVADKCSRSVNVYRISSGAPIPETTTEPPADIMKIAYAGRIVEEQKQASLMTRALLRATSEIGGVEATLYGDGGASENVEKIIAASGSSRVRLAGPVASHEMQQRFLESHVIVLLSDYEGTPMAVMEAMACGVVPVCLRVRSGVSELVVDGVTGLLVNDRGDEFVTAIRRLRNDQTLWQGLSRNAREHIISHFSIEGCTDQWNTLIKEIHQGSQAGIPFVRPDRIRLQPTHPGFAHQDQRAPSRTARIIDRLSTQARRSRMFAGKIKRRILGQPVS